MRISLLQVSVAVSLLALGAACGDSGGSGGSTGEGGSTGSDTTSAGGSGTTSSATTTSATTTTTTTATTTTGAGGGGTTNPNLPTSAECQAECEEGKTGDCTLIVGECDTCCDAALVLAESACDDEMVAYYECVEAGSPTACDTDCTSIEQDLSDCAIAYCTANLTDPNCITLYQCFNQ